MRFTSRLMHRIEADQSPTLPMGAASPAAPACGAHRRPRPGRNWQLELPVCGSAQQARRCRFLMTVRALHRAWFTSASAPFTGRTSQSTCTACCEQIPPGASLARRCSGRIRGRRWRHRTSSIPLSSAAAQARPYESLARSLTCRTPQPSAERCCGQWPTRRSHRLAHRHREGLLPRSCERPTRSGSPVYPSRSRPSGGAHQYPGLDRPCARVAPGGRDQAVLGPVLRQPSGQWRGDSADRDAFCGAEERRVGRLCRGGSRLSLHHGRQDRSGDHRRRPAARARGDRRH
jgi:hypothetical protein